MKKLLLLMMFLLSFLPLVSGADIYVAYDFTFEFDTPSSIYIDGAQCVDNDCTNVNSNSVELFNGNDFEACYSSFQGDSNANKFLTCIASSKINGNVADLSDMDFVVIKEDTTAPFGSIIQFFASGDSYRPYDYKSFGFSCNYDICIDPDAKLVPFTKVHNAIAEIQKLNVKNIDDETKPIQIEIPVEIEETVCSAFTFVNPDRYRFEAPLGYSDYSANTRVTLDITNFNTGASYLHQAINIPIEADTCAGLAAFSWTPSADLENVEIKFRGETNVIDNQAASSIMDWAEVVETIYPSNLDGTCWTRAYDFTLSNEATTDLTTSLAQIEVGESLFANVMVGAWRDESLTPMDYKLDVYFSNEKYYTHTGTTSGSEPSLVSFDLTNVISSLGAGQYPVKLVSTPLGSNCDIAEAVTQTQNLQLMPAKEFKVSFYVRDEENNYLQNVTINFELIDADNNYVVDPVYNKIQNTDINGKTVFMNVVPGDYVYKVSKNSFVSVTKSVHIGADSQIYVTLPELNSAPRIELPDSYTVYYLDDVEFDMKNYVSDFNDAYADLTINSEVLSGNADVYHFGSNYVISSTTPNHAKVKFTVTDPSGARDYDIVDVYFIDNKQPEVLKFVAEPDNGEVDFTTYFAVEVSDAENDALTCTIVFGDGSNDVTKNCDLIDGIAHTYTRVGTFNAKLIVSDSISDERTAYEQVFVFAHEYGLPHIDFFSLDSSNGKYVPTNLDLNWSVSHPDNLPMTCTLRVNAVSHPVSCNGNFDIDNFNKLGESRFTIVAVDSNGNQALRHIDKTFVKMESLPVISEFSANPNLGYGSLNSYFTIVAYDTDGDDLTCTLDFGDGSQDITDDCEDLNGISHLYTQVGVYNVNLRVSDGDNVVFDSLQVEVKMPTDSRPKIVSFSLDSSNGGFVPSDLTFNWKAVHPYNKVMTCTLYINTESHIVPCEGSYNEYDYDIVGLGVFTIKADDGTYTDSRTIKKTFVKETEEEKAPVIDLFAVSPSYGVEKLTSYFTVKVHDVNGDALTCTLEFGDGQSVTDSCENVDGISHEYLVGDYNVKLTVKDGIFTVVDTAFVKVVEASDNRPFIEYFTLDSSNGNIVPSDLTFNWKAVHPYNKAMTCTLYINSDSHIVPCVGSLTDYGYDLVGLGVFTIKADDGTYTDSRTIQRVFEKEVEVAPVIDLFVVSPNYGIQKLTSYFTIKVHDVNGDSLNCVLSFGDGQSRTGSCDSLDGISHEYLVGDYDVTLTVTDGMFTVVDTAFVRVVEAADSRPVIEYFTLDSSNGYVVPTDLTFNWKASHKYNKPMTCTLYINSNSQNVPCVGSLNDYGYNVEGLGVFRLVANDGTYTDEEIIKRTFVRINDLPVIDVFSANPKLGVGSLTSVFTVNVYDVNSDALTCTLQFGDGSQVVDSCNNLNGISHDYNNVGVYSAVLIATDGKGASYAYERLEVVSIEDGSPVINWFTLTTDTGDYTVSNNLTFNWDVSHPFGKAMICTLDINGNINYVPCVGSFDENNYNLVGQGVFTLRANDGMNSAQRVINQLFVPREDENNTIDFSLDMISLIVDDVLVPGEFDFGIIVKNETLASRTLTFRPYIICNGVKAGLDEKDRYFDGYLDSHAISKFQREEGFVYEFNTDSRKYKAQIPTGTSCRFSVQVIDKYGTDIEVSKGVMFKYPEAEKGVQSIRGNGFDIMNYMNSVVTNSIQKGYNSIEFDIENKDGVSRDISITMISRELGINYHVEAKLGPGQKKNIQIPLFIDEDIDSGLYSLRLGVNDGDDKQVRYTKVKINK